MTLLEDLKKQTRRLTTHEKATLARFLIATLDEPNANEADQLWVAESQRRYQALSKRRN
jgi:predicted amino acid dehydrogenase